LGMLVEILLPALEQTGTKVLGIERHKRQLGGQRVAFTGGDLGQIVGCLLSRLIEKFGMLVGLELLELVLELGQPFLELFVFGAGLAVFGVLWRADQRELSWLGATGED